VAQTIGQHGVAAFTSPVNGDLLNATVVLSNDNTTRSAYVDHDIDSGIHVQSSLLAARPAAGTAGRKWMTTDTGDVNLWFDTGTAWEEIAYVPSVGGNAATATALQTGRAINGVTFDGTAAITVTAAAGTLTGATLAAGVTASSLTSVGTLGSLTVTNPITGSVTGNAATATALQTARNINGVAFDGTANITVPPGAADASTLTGATLASNVLASSLTSVGTLTSLAVTGDLTVDTSTLKVDSTNNRVGVVNASPAYTLDVGGNANVSTGSTYKVNGVDTLSATTLGSAVVTSSLTSVGALNAGSITSGFGAINIGTDAFTGAGTGLTGTASGLTAGGNALLVTNTFTGAQIGTVTALTSTSAAIAINLATNNNFSHTTTENTTLSAPSNPVAGQSGVITITQGGTARTLAYNTFWKFAGGTVPTLTTTAGAVDVFAYNVESATRCTAQLIKDVK